MHREIFRDRPAFHRPGSMGGNLRLARPGAFRPTDKKSAARARAAVRGSSGRPVDLSGNDRTAGDPASVLHAGPLHGFAGCPFDGATAEQPDRTHGTACTVHRTVQPAATELDDPGDRRLLPADRSGLGRHREGSVSARI